MAQAIFIIGFIELYCSLTNFGITQYIYKHNQVSGAMSFALNTKVLLSILAIIPAGLYLFNASIISSAETIVFTILLPTLILHGLSRFHADIQEINGLFASAQLMRATPSIFRFFGAIIIYTNPKLMSLGFIVLLEFATVLGSAGYGTLKNIDSFKAKHNKTTAPAARYMASFYMNDLLFIPVSPSFVRVLASSFLSSESLVTLGIIQTFLYPIARFSPATLMRGTIIRELSNSEHKLLKSKSRKILLQTNLFSLISSIAVLIGLFTYLHTAQAKVSSDAILIALLGCVGMWIVSQKMLEEVIAQIHGKEALIVKSSFYSMLSGILFCTLSIFIDFLWIAVGGLSALVWILYYKSAADISKSI